MKSLLIKFLTVAMMTCGLYLGARAQEDSTSKDTDERPVVHTIDLLNNLADSLKKIQIVVGKMNEDLTFSGTRLVNREMAEDAPGILTLSGYISTYYAYYSDSVPVGTYEKFPTVAPYSDAFGLNIAQMSANFAAEKSRANLTIHYGDIPKSAWSPAYNLVQEANAGLRLAPRLWLDAGFFRTHIGLESIQPRENITSSIAIVTYFEPYFMSGAKLTYILTPELYLQLNAFNSFSTFTENNRKKAFGISGMYEPGTRLSITFNSLFSDNAPVDTNVSFARLYNNFYLTYRTERITLGFEANLGVQEHAGLGRTGELSTMYSGLLALKYQLISRLYAYGRFDYFSDPDELLTGPIYNDYHKLIGLDLLSYTAGLEIRVVENSYLRFEGRYMQSTLGQELFYHHNAPSNFRYEVITALGVWF